MPLVFALAATIIIEYYLQLRWSPSYFVTGIRLFNERIPAPKAARERMSLNSLERDVAPLTWLDFVFKTLPDGRIGFRESFAPGLTGPMKRYYPVMRGLVEVDERRKEIRVIGVCNWNVLIIPFILLAAVVFRPGASPLLILPVVFVIGYFIQRKAYFKVVEAVKAQLSDDIRINGFPQPRRTNAIDA